MSKYEVGDILYKKRESSYTYDLYHEVIDVGDGYIVYGAKDDLKSDRFLTIPTKVTIEESHKWFEKVELDDKNGFIKVIPRAKYLSRLCRSSIRDRIYRRHIIDGVVRVMNDCGIEDIDKLNVCRISHDEVNEINEFLTSTDIKKINKMIGNRVQEEDSNDVVEESLGVSKNVKVSQSTLFSFDE